MSRRLLAALLAVSSMARAQAPAGLRWIDAGSGEERASLSLVRSPPLRWSDDAPLPEEEGAFRLLWAEGDAPPEGLVLAAEAPDGRPLDQLEINVFRPHPCPAGAPAGRRCVASLPVRLAMDLDDRMHPAAAERSLLATLGGQVVVSRKKQRLLSAPVLAPRGGLWQSKIRVFLVRERPQGPPPFGFTDGTAEALTRAQIRRANAVWGQCGVSFGPPEAAEVKIVDPPSSALLAFGCGAAFRASGGRLSFRIEGREVAIALSPGQSAASVARRAASAIEKMGFRAVLSENLRTGAAAAPSVDLMARRRDGALLSFSSLASSDATLGVCLGSVDLSDGLQHFTDVDAVAGTLEERTLLRSVDDGDPRTIEVVLIPSFATGGRIGESFIHSDRGSLRNMILEDRAGIRADAVSFALAHELGHVLLDVPGHSDDFGRDTPGRLMDSDAADPSPFGPRRLTLAECDRALRQSGPSAAAPLLSPAAPPGRTASPRRR
ncbi:MAG: hypothetical protein MUF64_14760 [Polyangiaceae bacterium]|nr:hypothetical protein [Polyangiaceae bacterium]